MVRKKKKKKERKKEKKRKNAWKRKSPSNTHQIKLTERVRQQSKTTHDVCEQNHPHYSTSLWRESLRDKTHWTGDNDAPKQRARIAFFKVNFPHFLLLSFKLVLFGQKAPWDNMNGRTIADRICERMSGWGCLDRACTLSGSSCIHSEEDPAWSLGCRPLIGGSCLQNLRHNRKVMCVQTDYIDPWKQWGWNVCVMKSRTPPR